MRRILFLALVLVRCSAPAPPPPEPVPEPVRVEPAPSPVVEEKVIGTVRVSASALNVRREASTDAEVVSAARYRWVLAHDEPPLIGYDQAAYDAIVEDYRGFAESIGIAGFTPIPISGFKGDNITSKSDNTPWYDGVPLVEHLERAVEGLGGLLARDVPVVRGPEVGQQQASRPGAGRRFRRGSRPGPP